MCHFLTLYREMISLRGLTNHTVKSYSTYIRAYLDYLSHILHKSPQEVSWQDLRDFIQWLQRSRSLSDRTVNTAISQLRFFTIFVLHQSWEPTQLPLRRFDSFLPSVPSKEQVSQFISSMPDLKQKTMVAVLYSAGLRIGELCQLRYSDIDRKQMRIHIRHSKSRQDRYAILSTEALALLTQYWFAYGRPQNWLFPKQNGTDLPIDTFFLSRHIQAHQRRLGWNTCFTCHSFRHAFGTHLYENGTDLLTIQVLLGHKSIRSTTIYIHLASNGTHSAISPFDLLGGAFHA